MKYNLKYIFSSFLLFVSFMVYGQAVSVSSNSIDFGNVFENAPETQSITITNPHDFQIEITDIAHFTYYGSYDFTVSETDFFLGAGAQKTIDITFSPRHNMMYNSEIILISDRMGAVSINVVGQGLYSNAYYAGSQNLKEEALKSSLQTIISNGYVSGGYNGARDEMYMFIDNQKENGQGATQNRMETAYTGRIVSGYTSRQDAQTNDNVNTEHTFPQGQFNSNEPMKSDLFHLYVTDAPTNSTRSNKPFGIVTNPTWENGGSKSNSTTFEPRDVHKGNVARAMLYFVVRYQNYNNYLNGQEAILKQWHVQFPTTAIEETRNADIFAFQNNRNPFIDYPQLVERITNFSSSSSEEIHTELFFSSDEIIMEDVAVGSLSSYHYVVYNASNVDLPINAISLDNPALTFANNSGQSTTVAPGESHTIEINFSPVSASMLNANLLIETPFQQYQMVTVPISANGTTGTKSPEKSINSSLEIFPNPTSQTIRLQGDFVIPGEIVNVYKKNGAYIRSFLLDENGHINISSLNDGIYLVEYKGRHSTVVVLK